MPPEISILIPTYSMKGLGHLLIQTAFRSIKGQSYQNFEVIVSDQSEDSATEEVCGKWKDQINLRYFRNPNSKGGCFQNENYCMSKAEGTIFKYLDADDFFLLPTSLQTIVNNFTPETMWMFCNYHHSYDRIQLINEHVPSVNPHLYISNTLGTPSAMAMRNMGKDNLLFDEHLFWSGDCEFYYRMYKKYGAPKILNTSVIVHYLWAGQVENSFPQNQMIEETNYILSIHEP
jgi:glycosyltransferase involved in cell wall biosynthesis